MTAIFTPEVVQVVGAVIVGAVLIHVALTLVSSFRRRAHERDQRRVSLEGLQHRAKIQRELSSLAQAKTDLTSGQAAITRGGYNRPCPHKMHIETLT